MSGGDRRPEALRVLASEVIGFHDCMDGSGPGDGRFQITGIHDVEQTRLNFRAVLREAHAVLLAAADREEPSTSDQPPETGQRPAEQGKERPTVTPFAQPAAVAGDDRREKVMETAARIITRSMRDHRMSNMTCDYSEFYPLVDALSAPGMSIADGEEQIDEIVDAFILELGDAILALVAPQVDAALERAAEPEEADDNDQMERISALISRLKAVHDQFGDTCVYIRRGGLSWGAVALNRQHDDQTHGVFDLQAQHDRDMEDRLGQVEHLLASMREWRQRAWDAEAKLAATEADMAAARAEGERLRTALEIADEQADAQFIRGMKTAAKLLDDCVDLGPWPDTLKDRYKAALAEIDRRADITRSEILEHRKGRRALSPATDAVASGREGS